LRWSIRFADAEWLRRNSTEFLNPSGAIGLAVLATVAASASRHELVEGQALANALNHGYALALLIMGAISAAGALTASLLELHERPAALIPLQRPASPGNAQRGSVV
jgi:hypothetical protein